MKKVLNYIFFLIVFGSLCFQNGCGASNKIQGNQQTNQEEVTLTCSYLNQSKTKLATVYKGNIIKNLIMDCQSYTKYRPNETTGGIFVSWRRKEELPTGA